MRGGAAGRERERMVAETLRADGWVVVKGTTYGTCDLVALKAGSAPRLIEVKSTLRNPFNAFGPADREQLSAEAHQAGGDALLAWWPPDRKGLRWFGEADWPLARTVS